jgi:hypothetical protein
LTARARTARAGTRVAVVCLFLLLASVLAPGTALAYQTFGGHHLVYGVGDYGANNQHYWIASGATEFETTIDNAMHDWIYTTDYWGITTPISYTQTTVQSNSRMDIHHASVYADWWGITEWYHGDGTVVSKNASGEPTENWVWGKIRVSPDFSDCPNKKGVVAHEMGHVMGLAHVTSGTKLMRWDIAGLDIHRAQPDDLNGINYLY